MKKPRNRMLQRSHTATRSTSSPLRGERTEVRGEGNVRPKAKTEDVIGRAPDLDVTAGHFGLIRRHD